MRYDVHAAEAVSRAFLDHEGEHDALLVRLVARSRAHAHVGIAVGKIEAAQEVEVALDAVGVVDVVAEEEAEQIAFAALDHAFELVCRVCAVADEQDLPHGELVALLDRTPD